MRTIPEVVCFIFFPVIKLMEYIQGMLGPTFLCNATESGGTLWNVWRSRKSKKDMQCHVQTEQKKQNDKQWSTKHCTKKLKFEQHETHINSNAPEVNFDFFRHLYL
jgi:hypothetical protein